MLEELHVENLGVIADLDLVLGPGMTAVTGETGTGKTLMVEAIELLLGARADSGLVRAGAHEARLEARFSLETVTAAALADGDGRDPVDVDEGEVVLSRVVPADGRSRAYLNGRLVTAGLMAEVGRLVVDLHGQHTHHQLLSPAAQRDALDHFAGDSAASARLAYDHARRRIREIDDRLGELGGEERARAREIDLLSFQVEEIDRAEIDAPDEEERLAAEEQRLANAQAIRSAAATAHDTLGGPATDALGSASAALGEHETLRPLRDRVRVLQDEVAELARAIRAEGESVEDDPDRLDMVVERRRLLEELRRKYGETLADVLAYRDEAASRLDALVGAETRAAELDRERQEAKESALLAARQLSEVRRAAAPKLAAEIEALLAELAMPGARFEVVVASRTNTDRAEAGREGAALPADGLDTVEFRLSANRGERAAPLARVASGGELARTMLAARVVLTEAPPTLVFDEVDAGIGGQAGVAVGRKLALVARQHQVICVTHLAQVAAFADHHVVVEKHERDGRTVVGARAVDGPDRVRELSRMLAGTGTERARDHAEELLHTAARDRTP